MKNDFRYEQTYESKKKQNIQETVEYILSKDYGTTVENAELAKLLGYNIDTEEEFIKYRNMMTKVRNFLLQYGYVLKTVTGIGYYILKPAQISRHCYKAYIKRAGRLYDKSAFVLDKVDQSELTHTRKEELENIKNLNEQLIETTDKVLLESKYYSRKNYYDNLNDDMETYINELRTEKEKKNNAEKEL